MGEIYDLIIIYMRFSWWYRSIEKAHVLLLLFYIYITTIIVIFYFNNWLNSLI